MFHAVQRERVLEDPRFLARARQRELVHEHRHQRRRHHVSQPPAEQLLGRRDEESGIARVVIEIHAVLIEEKHQVRQRPQRRPIPRLAVAERLLGSPAATPLHEECADEQRLRAEDHGGAEHVSSV